MKLIYRVLIGLGIVLLLAGIIYKILHKEPTISTNNIADIIKLQRDTTTHYKDKSGDSHALRPVVTSDNRDAIIALYKDSLNKQAKKLGIDAEQITQFGQIVSEQKGRVKVITQYVDSGKNKIGFSFSDYYLKVKGMASVLDTGSYFEYSSVDTLNYTFFNKHQNFLQKLTSLPQQNFDVTNKNKRGYISNISSVIIPPPADSHIKVGFYLGYGATMSTKTNQFTAGPQLGAGLTYKFQ